MSLINDALKRAKEAQAKEPPRASGGPPFQEPEPPSPASKGPWFAGVVIACLLVVLVWAYLTSPGRKPADVSAAQARVAEPFETLELSAGEPPPAFQTAPPKQFDLTASAGAASPPAFMATPESNAAPPPTLAQTALDSAPQQPATAAVTNVPAVPTMETRAPEKETVQVAARDPSQMPEIKLHAIHFRLKKPSVMVNGKILYEGDAYEGAKLLEIQRQSALFEYAGRTHRLQLGQPEFFAGPE